MSAPVDVLAVLDDAIVVLKSAQLGANSDSIGGVTVESVQAACGRIAGRLEHVEAARAAIAELIAAVNDAVMFSSMAAQTRESLRAALARVGGA